MGSPPSSQSNMASGNHEGIWFVKKYDEEYWDNYLAARPKYQNDGFYERLFSYHDVHSGSYDLAHDVGTGPGQVANVISTKFNTVVASDANETHLNICKHRNASIAAKLSFILSKGEDIAAKVPPASADAIYCGEALALMNTETAISGFARILKSNGTAAVWYYGRPVFPNEECQALYNKIVNKKFEEVIGGGGPAKAATWKGPSDIMASWLDCVEFPTETWKDVERYKWNSGRGRMMFHDGDACGFPIEPSSAIKDDEKVIEMSDETMWAESWDVNEVRRFVDANLPSFFGEANADPQVETWYAELEKVMGGKSAKKSIAWPVVLLLATKR